MTSSPPHPYARRRGRRGPEQPPPLLPQTGTESVRGPSTAPYQRGQQPTILIAEQKTRRHARVSARCLLRYLEIAFGLCSAMADAKIVLTVPGGRADLSRTDAQWLSEHLPSDSVLLSQLQAASELDMQGAYVGVIEISLMERDAVKQAILEARGRAETVPDAISTLERIL